jgi:hypothetical protein
MIVRGFIAGDRYIWKNAQWNLQTSASELIGHILIIIRFILLIQTYLQCQRWTQAATLSI